MSQSKKFEFASTHQIEELDEIANDFMFKLFELMPGEFVISDESKLTDFAEFGSSDTSSIWATINKVYGIDRSYVDSDYLVTLFREIQTRIFHLELSADFSSKQD